MSTRTKQIIASFLAVASAISSACIAFFLVVMSEISAQIFDWTIPGTSILWWAMVAAALCAICFMVSSLWFRPQKIHCIVLASLHGLVGCWLAIVIYWNLSRLPAFLAGGVIVCIALEAMLVVAFAWTGVCTIAVWLLSRPSHAGQCPHCGYPLTVVSGRPCPECGKWLDLVSR